MKRIFSAYKDLLGTIYKSAPMVVIFTFIGAILLGFINPLSVYVNQLIINDGLSVAKKEMSFQQYIPVLVGFALCAIIPSILNLILYGYVNQRSQLILQSDFRGRMLKKLETMKYEHFESDKSKEIIDKAYNRADNAARHLFPMYLVWNLSSIVAIVGFVLILFQVRWWLLLTVFVPAILETYLESKQNFNIYLEMDSYWKKEHTYSTIAGFLRNRDYIKENKLFGSSDYLIDSYRTKLNARNREYEKYFFKALKWKFLNGNITKIAQLGNALLLLYLCIHNQITIGALISLTLPILTTIYSNFGGCTQILRWGGFHLISFDYYNKYLNLSDEESGEISSVPDCFDIEFKDVWFRYPNTDKDILKGLSFRIEHGQRVSIVGENGEGKSTMIKLLMGLFQQDRGEILINGKPLLSYTKEVRNKIFGTVFQDFVKYNMSLEENIGIGDIENIANEKLLENAMAKGKVTPFLTSLEQGSKTILGKEFEGGVDLSGGQWQRVAIARAFMGDKPIILLDEPTSQLDPIAESQLYSEFAEMVKGKTAVFITHRLASTMITDRIFVIHNGIVTENGTHEELMKQSGLYAEMFESQKQWYEKSNTLVEAEI